MTTKLTKLTLHGLPGFKEPIEFEAKQVTAFIGPNGAGKTTVLRAAYEALRFFADRTVHQTKAPRSTWTAWSRAEAEYRTSDGRTFELSAARQGEKLVVERIIEGTEARLLDSKGQFPDPESHKAALQKISQHETRIATLEQRLTSAQDDASKQQLHNSISAQRQALAEAETKLQTLAEFTYRPAWTETDESAKSITISDRILQDKFDIPSPMLIEARHNPADTVNKLLVTAIRSKMSKNQRLYQEICRELGALLEANVDIHAENPEQPQLIVDNTEHRFASSGTLVCLYWYCLTRDLGASAIVLWDEPENSLHASRRHLLMHQLLQQSSPQSILGTHASEFISLNDVDCAGYRLEKDRAFLQDEPHVVEGPTLTLSGITTRRDCFRVAEDLGIQPARALFTANVVVWVEGPTELLFWRHMLTLADPRLVEGFDYAIVMYGGSNIAHVVIEDERRTDLQNLAAISRFLVVTADSDLTSGDDEPDPDAEGPEEEQDPVRPRGRTQLKRGVLALQAAVNQANKEREGSALMVVTGGKEIENLLPLAAIRAGLAACLTHPNIDWDEFDFGTNVSYLTELENFLKNKSIRYTSGRHNGKLIGVKQWSDKPALMRKSLAHPALRLEDLRVDGEKRVREVADFIWKRCESYRSRRWHP